jgi:hypothetical protein
MDSIYCRPLRPLEAVGTIGKSHYTVGRRREKSFAVFLELWAEITFALPLYRRRVF